MSEEKPFINVLLLGERDSGKSSFLQLFTTYLKYGCINHNVTAGTTNELRTYRTEDITDCIFHVKNVKLRLIDTPGFSHNESIDGMYNLNNMKKIICHITKYEHINAIAIVIRSSLKELKYIFEYLLPHFNKSVCQNIIFITFHDRSIESLVPEIKYVLRDFLEENPCLEQRIFQLNSYLPRRYLDYSERYSFGFISDEERWKQDSTCCQKFIDYIANENNARLKPHFIKQIKNVTTKPCSLQNTMNIPMFRNEIKVTETPTIIKLRPKKPLKRNQIELQQVQEAIDTIQLHSVQRSNSTYGMLGNSQYYTPSSYNSYSTNIPKTTAEQIVINQGLTNEIKLLKQQNDALLVQQNILNEQNTKLEQTIKIIQTELNSIKADTVKNLQLIYKVENVKQENISKQVGLINECTNTVEILEKAFNKHEVQAGNQQILNNQVKQQVDNLQVDTKTLKKELSDITQAGIHPINQRVNNLQVDIKNLKESIQLINNSNVSHDENHQALVNQRIDNLSGDVKIVKQSVKELSNITLIEDHPINQRVNNLHDDITNIKEFMQDLSNEIKEMKQLNTTLKQQSTSGVQAETLHCNQQADGEEPKKFQKLIEDVNILNKIKEKQESDEEINVEEQEDNAVGETSQSAQPKSQKLIEDLSDLKKLKERKNPNENNEMMEEVKRVTGEQISKQFEDLKFFIRDTLANKQNGEDEEVHNKQEKRKKKKKSSKNN